MQNFDQASKILHVVTLSWLIVIVGVKETYAKMAPKTSSRVQLKPTHGLVHVLGFQL